MYSKKSWNGPVDPFIQVKFINNTLPEEEDPTVSLVIFEWKDRKFVGVPDGSGENVGYHSLLQSSPTIAR